MGQRRHELHPHREAKSVYGEHPSTVPNISDPQTPKLFSDDLQMINLVKNSSLLLPYKNLIKRHIFRTQNVLSILEEFR